MRFNYNRRFPLNSRVIPLTEYLTFARANLRFLGFGFVMALTSSAGQTYFIGVFGPSVRETFALSHTEWGTIYMVGTLLSALVLPWSGNLIDRFQLRYYAIVVMCGLVAACLVMSLTSSALMLVLSIFMLRQFGQGLTNHTGITSMARYMARGRGKAIALSSMGFATGEALLPFLAVGAIVAIGWRSTYQVTAMAVLCMIPLAMWLLRGHHLRHATYLSELDNGDDDSSYNRPSRSRRQMLGEGRFYLLLPALLAPSYVATGLFFHHLTLAEAKGWSGTWVTGNYWVYALCAAFASLSSGPLIDRFTAARVIRFYLVPMIMALLLLGPVVNQWWVVPYMMLIGLNTGIYFTTFSSIWPELYGTRYIGGIKSLVGALGVLASALGPVSIGGLLDLGFSFEAVCALFAGFCAMSTVLLLIGLGRYDSN